MDQNKNANRLAFYRRRIRYSQKQVTSLLDLEQVGTLSRYEQGRLMPTLTTALRLGAIYRVPVDFLYHPLYEELRLAIRAKEATMRGSAQQGVLF
jgi:transcriptional regulator with XRE-family HTH domain